MNYSRKKSDTVIAKIFRDTVGTFVILFITALICCNTDYVAEADRSASEPATVELPYDVPLQASEAEETADDGFINPTTGVLTSAFGERWGRQHNGIDIGADTDTMIYAAADGIVTYAGEMSGYGNYIVIDHQNGYETAYAHCNAIFVSLNQHVKKGESIAHVGSTGNSTGPHLHFEIKSNGEYLDPLEFVVY